jgi:hypothetical protein
LSCTHVLNNNIENATCNTINNTCVQNIVNITNNQTIFGTRVHAIFGTRGRAIYNTCLETIKESGIHYSDDPIILNMWSKGEFEDTTNNLILNKEEVIFHIWKVRLLYTLIAVTLYHQLYSSIHKY